MSNCAGVFTQLATEPQITMGTEGGSGFMHTNWILDEDLNRSGYGYGPTLRKPKPRAQRAELAARLASGGQRCCFVAPPTTLINRASRFRRPCC